MNREEIDAKLAEYKSTRVAYHSSQRSRWVYDLVGSDAHRWNHRDILPHEVILDFDEDDLDQNSYWSSKIHKKLERKGIKHSLWRTGGRGVHIHTFWKGLGSVAEKKLLKELLADWMTEGFDVKIDRQLFGKHMIRYEWGHHEKSLPNTQYKEPVFAKDHFVYNDIPEFIYDKYKEKVFEFALRKLRFKHGDIKFKYETPECIKFISSDAFGQRRDGGKRALFVLASFYRNLPNEELGPLLSRYNKYNLKDPLPKSAIIHTVESVRSHKGRHVGCHYRHQLLRELGFGDVVEKCESVRDAKLKEALIDNETQSNKNT